MRTVGLEIKELLRVRRCGVLCINARARVGGRPERACGRAAGRGAEQGVVTLLKPEKLR